MNKKIPLEQRLLGVDGFGPDKFAKNEGPAVRDQMECWLTTLQKDRDESIPLDLKKSEQIINIARHERMQSFAINGNGNGSGEAWEQVRTLARDFSHRESEAYFRLSKSDTGFKNAMYATMIALESGYVLGEVKKATEKREAVELRDWFAQLTPSMQKELESIIAEAARTFWAAFIERGWLMLAEWGERIGRQLNQSNDKKGGVKTRKLTNHKQIRYADDYMPERLNPVDVVTPLHNGELSPEEVIAALSLLSEQMYGGDEAKPGRKSSRIDGIIAAVRNTHSVILPLDDLEASFKSTQNPRKTASSYMSDIAKLLNLTHSPVAVDAETVYRFHRRPPLE